MRNLIKTNGRKSHAVATVVAEEADLTKAADFSFLPKNWNGKWDSSHTFFAYGCEWHQICQRDEKYNYRTKQGIAPTGNHVFTSCAKDTQYYAGRIAIVRNGTCVLHKQNTSANTVGSLFTNLEIEKLAKEVREFINCDNDNVFFNLLEAAVKKYTYEMEGR